MDLTPPGGRARLLAVLVPLAVVALAAGLRLVDLGSPGRIYFDETYYADHAQEYLERGVERERPAHPPLGKWLIAAGIEAFGFDPVGWRVAAAVAGTVTVLVVHRLGLRLFRDVWAAGLGAALLAVDGLALTASRMAMLDGFLALFVALGAWLVLVDRDRSVAGEATLARWLAGVAFGAGLGVKWPAGLALGAAVALVAVWSWRAGRRGRRLVAGVVLPLLVVPALVYVLTWAGWFANFERTETARERCADPPCAVGVTDVADAWWDEQVELVAFQRRLGATHPDRSWPYAWPLQQRPVLYYLETCEEDAAGADAEACEVAPGRSARILGLGNPAVWWVASAAAPVLAWAAVRRRSRAAVVLLAFLLVQWLPWFASWKRGFSFYLVPVAPFACLTVAWLGWRAARRPRLRWVPALLLLLAVGAFLWLRPFWYAEELSPAAVEARRWLDGW